MIKIWLIPLFASCVLSSARFELTNAIKEQHIIDLGEYKKIQVTGSEYSTNNGEKCNVNGEITYEDFEPHQCHDGINWEILQGYWRNSGGNKCTVEGKTCTFDNGESFTIEFDGNDYIMNDWYLNHESKTITWVNKNGEKGFWHSLTEEDAEIAKLTHDDVGWIITKGNCKWRIGRLQDFMLSFRVMVTPDYNKMMDDFHKQKQEILDLKANYEEIIQKLEAKNKRLLVDLKALDEIRKFMFTNYEEIIQKLEAEKDELNETIRKLSQVSSEEQKEELIEIIEEKKKKILIEQTENINVELTNLNVEFTNLDVEQEKKIPDAIKTQVSELIARKTNVVEEKMKNAKKEKKSKCCCKRIWDMWIKPLFPCATQQYIKTMEDIEDPLADFVIPDSEIFAKMQEEVDQKKEEVAKMKKTYLAKHDEATYKQSCYSTFVFSVLFGILTLVFYHWYDHDSLFNVNFLVTLGTTSLCTIYWIYLCCQWNKYKNQYKALISKKL